MLDLQVVERRRALLAAGVSLLLAKMPARGAPLKGSPGSFVEELGRRAVRGQVVWLARQRGGQHATLLSFIDTAAPIGPNQEPSRARARLCKSMDTQYRSRGLRVVMVDFRRPRTPPHDAAQVLNFTYDWSLDEIPVLADEDAELASRLAVSTPPTSFLIDGDRRILRRWDGPVPPAEIGTAIDALFGASRRAPPSRPPSALR